MKPAIPSDESQRLRALRNLRILDTPSEERFDKITRLARHLFGTDIALVSLVDADRQWFKSRMGLDATQTHRDVSFCGHVILDEEVMVVNDAANDERFCDNPLVCGDPNIRFYAGCPIKAPDGSRVGTLCVIDSKPKDFSDEQVDLLRDLGGMVEEELAAVEDATTDSVTGMANRKGFLATSERLLSLCRRQREPATLLMFLLRDHFEYEERHGRYEGDAIVLETSRLLLSCLETTDVIARTELDCFGVLLASRDSDDAKEVSRRFFEQLRQHNSEADRDREIVIDLYVVAYDPDVHETAGRLLKAGEDLIVDGWRTNPAGD